MDVCIVLIIYYESNAFSIRYNEVKLINIFTDSIINVKLCFYADKPGDSCAPAYCLGASNCPGATCASGTYQCQVDYTWVNQIQIAHGNAVETSGACVLSSGKSWPNNLFIIVGHC